MRAAANPCDTCVFANDLLISLPGAVAYAGSAPHAFTTTGYSIIKTSGGGKHDPEPPPPGGLVLMEHYD